MTHERTIDLAERARAAAKGDKLAAHAILEAVQDDVYGLALRMLGRPADAEDAAQEILDERLRTGLRQVSEEPDPEDRALAREIRLRCTQAMLLGLDRELRIAYVLGDIFNLSVEEAAEVLGSDLAAYRKRLSLSRARPPPRLSARLVRRVRRPAPLSL